MKAEIMIEQLSRKFGSFALAQSVWLHTQRTTDIHELTEEELHELYNIFFPKTDPVAEMYHENRLKELRSIILKDAQYIGLYNPQDWAPFNRFMLEKSVLKKPLYKYTEGEFPQLIRQFKSMRQRYNQRATQPGTWEWHHKNRLPKPSAN